MPEIVTANLTVNFTADNQQTANKGGIALEVDSRPDGLNGGNTSFRPGDDVHILRFITGNVNITVQQATAGSLAGAGSGLFDVLNLAVSFNNQKEVSLSKPVSSGFSIQKFGRTFDAKGQPKTLNASLVDSNAIALPEPGYGFFIVSYKASYNAFKLSGVPVTTPQAMVFALGEIPD